MAGLGVAAIEGGFVAVVAKSVFADALPAATLNLGVAFAAAAPAMANLMSFYWADFGAGRRKSQTVGWLLALAALSMVAVTLLPTSAWGLVGFVVAVLAARVFWTGSITLRSAVWRANFDHEVRTVYTARVALLTSLGMAITSAAAGLALDADMASYRWIYPLAGIALGLAGLHYRRLRVRGQRELLAAELTAREGSKRGLAGAWSLLREDRKYRRYMVRMFFFGSGNLMIVSINVLLMAEILNLARFQQMLVTSTIPMLAIPLVMPIWAQYFNAVNVARFRAIQGVFFCLSMLVMWCGVSLVSVPLLWCAAALSGIGYAAGNISWHLGHNAFASDGRATDYMAVHVSLTGLRGIIAPIAGVATYQALYGIDERLAVHALWLPLALTTIGTFGFAQLDRELAKPD